MDIESEKVLELLFPDGISDSWKENPELYQYMAKIGGYDVDGLKKEPDRLINEKNFIQQSIQDLFFSNYKTFIHTADNSQEMFKKFNQSEAKLDTLLEKIPKFLDKCKSFCNTSTIIDKRRRLNNLILSKILEITEILELPQLMELCLQNNEYNGALELSQYARHLNGKYKDIPILIDIVKELENSWSLMVNQVVDSLKDDLPLPKCLYYMGLLRSMDAFTESELRMKFIQARDSWFQGLINAIPSNDSSSHLIRTIEMSRIYLFNIITQYKAIFNDDHLNFEKDSVINDSAIFYQWLEEKISQFVTIFEQDLFDTSIDSIIGQCTYFGLSFGRVGADFTTRMSDVLIKVTNTKIKNNIFRATEKFEKSIESFILTHKLKKSNPKIEPTINSENPPEQLVEYYPLAEYCNNLIAIFNDLRLSVPVALVQSFTTLLQNSLHTVAKTIFCYYKKRQQNFMPSDRQNMVKFSECFSEQLVPYVQYCIHALFPPNQIAAYFGSSVSQLQKEEISYLNQKYIIEPIQSLLPVKNLSMDIYIPDTSYSKNSASIISTESEIIQQNSEESAPDTSEETPIKSNELQDS